MRQSGLGRINHVFLLEQLRKQRIQVEEHEQHFLCSLQPSWCLGVARVIRPGHPAKRDQQITCAEESRWRASPGLMTRATVRMMSGRTLYIEAHYCENRSLHSIALDFCRLRVASFS